MPYNWENTKGQINWAFHDKPETNKNCIRRETDVRIQCLDFKLKLV